MTEETETFTAFIGPRRLARGSRAQIAAALLAANPAPHGAPALVFSDRSGRETDLDLSGGAAAVAARHAPAPVPKRGRGRPRLGVAAREVTLLPRHWDWLAAQPGGASAALRRLVDAARASDDGSRARAEAAYRFAHAIAGDLPGFEAAMRALFAGDLAGFAQTMASWPEDIRSHALMLAGSE